MLRPATPLAIIFFIAFVLLLLSTLSTPVIKAIPLASYKGYTFGVLGYCGPSSCISPQIGYNSDSLPSDIQKQFSLPSSTRHSLSSILIVHPVAAFLSLICFGFAIAAHFHAPSHSPRYLLGLLILTVPTLLLSLLAFLVDILLFIPHVSWGGWIVLASTILMAASFVLTCAMRRTLVSRKARKKRIEENADMSGANYYDQLAASRNAATDTAVVAPVAAVAAYEYPRAESPPPLSGDGAGKGGFTAYEMQPQDGRITDVDDYTPLNPGREPSIRSTSTGPGRRIPAYAAGEVPPMPTSGRPSMESNGRSRSRGPRRDQYGNIIPAAAAYGDLPPPGLPRRNSQGSLSSVGSARRGRGGYGPPARGGMPPRGALRGGPAPPGWRGRGRGGYGPPPRGYPPGPRGRGGYPPRGGYGPGPGATGQMRGPPPPEYIVDSPYYAVAGGREASPAPSHQSRGDGRFIADAAGAAVPIGTAIEMDERTGSPQGPMSPVFDGGQMSRGYGPNGGSAPGTIRTRTPVQSVPQDQYIAPRSNWDQASAPLAMPTPPIQANPVSPLDSQAQRPYVGGAAHTRSASGNYYEDIDPRFAVDDAPSQGPATPDGIPHVLTPGGMPLGTMRHTPGGYPTTPGAEMTAPSGQPFLGQTVPSLNFPEEDPSSLDQIPEGARSPAENSERLSEASHFTSISQRGINPAWQPGPGYGPGSMPSGSAASAVQRRREDAILSANPDFSLPGVGAMRGGRPSRGRAGNGYLSRPSPGHHHSGSAGGGLTPSGRYPTDL